MKATSGKAKQLYNYRGNGPNSQNPCTCAQARSLQQKIGSEHCSPALKIPKLWYAPKMEHLQYLDIKEHQRLHEDAHAYMEKEMLPSEPRYHYNI